MRALVADDDGVTAMVLAGMLSQWKLDVSVAADGQQAWDLLAAEPGPSLAVIDWEMPGLDGPELCRRIREDVTLAHVYVIMLTGRSRTSDVVAGLDAGADDYLVKPFDREELRARVKVGMRVVALQRRLADRLTALETAMAAEKQLQGLLPICCYCKCIRNDENYWQQIESYMSAHADVRFSHGICPACLPAAQAGMEPER
jgi:sigma-B regulation protein RsbU (phosphoserine phosphatase)